LRVEKEEAKAPLTIRGVGGANEQFPRETSSFPSYEKGARTRINR